MLKSADLFSGAGGLTIGLKRAGIAPIVSVEFKRDAMETYCRHTPEAAHFCEDIRKVDLSPFRGKVDVLHGGPPCQPWSTGGLRRAAADARNMIPAFLAAAETLRPVAIIMENVPGLVVASRINYLQGILAEFERLKYIPTWAVLNAAQYGVPQKRRRLFIVAFRDRRFWFPRPTHGPGTNRQVVPAGDVISFKPNGEPPNCPVVYAKYPDLRPSPYAGHVYNGGGRPINMAEPCHTILAAAGGYKTHWVDSQGIAPIYHKHLMEGGEPWTGEVPGARRITVEESALIQTFPPDLVIAGARSSQYTQVGDAVPPVLAEHVGRAVVAQLAGIDPTEATHYLPDKRMQLVLI